MTRTPRLVITPAIALAVAGTLSGCGPEANPGSPSVETSFLSGTWRGTVTIQVNPGDPNPPAPSTGEMTWTFEVVPQTNMMALRTTIRSSHPWLTMDTTGSTAVSPSNRPPTQLSTHGEFTSPRGCRGTFGSVGDAQATRIEADFTGTDCQQVTFAGRVVLTKS